MIPQKVAQALIAREARVTVVGDTLVASTGSAHSLRQVQFSVDGLRQLIANKPAQDARVLIASFVSGVDAALFEPLDHKARTWSFVDTAGRLVPSLRGEAFALGFSVVSGQQPWLVPFGEDLQVAYLIELDHGHCVLTQEHATSWGVTKDRITCAGRSLLFHKTWEVTPEQKGAWEVYQHPDDYNAARALILPDMDYDRARRGIVFGMPSEDLLMVTNRQNTPETLAEFAQALNKAFVEGNRPLSPAMYTWEDARHLRKFTLETP